MKEGIMVILKRLRKTPLMRKKKKMLTLLLTLKIRTKSGSVDVTETEEEAKEIPQEEKPKSV